LTTVASHFPASSLTGRTQPNCDMKLIMLDVTHEYDKYNRFVKSNTLNYRVLAARSNMVSKNPILTVVCLIQILGR